MKNKEIIQILKKDIQELKKNQEVTGYKIIKGLSINGYEVDLMASISGGSGLGYCFNKSIRTIGFKSENARNEFLLKCKQEGLK